MACKNCVHYDICLLHLKGDEDKRCQRFKNKADFVEVVRCKDCEYHEIRGLTTEYCVKNRMFVESDFYCSYGERKE